MVCFAQAYLSKYKDHHHSYTLQRPYNTDHCNTVLDITRFKVGSKKYIDYIEK